MATGDYSDFLNKYGKASGAAGIGSGLLGMFMGNENPADAAMPYLNQIEKKTSPYYEPYINAGRSALNTAQGEYGNLLRNPGGKLNEIGQNFQQSPGFKFALQQALQGSNHAAAAGGMAGSPQHEQQNMELATNLGNQDYYNWLQPATNLYGAGLSGTQHIGDQGMNASNSMADMIAQLLGHKANLAYEGQVGENQGSGANIGNLFGGAGLLSAFL